MSKCIDLIWLDSSGKKPSWELGQVWCVEPRVKPLSVLIEQQLSTTNAEAWVFRDSRLGAPAADDIRKLLDGPEHLWHGGLHLGMGGLPGLTDFVNPTWMLNCDPNPEIEATSWRLSFRSCIVRVDTLRQLGGICEQFLTLEGAALEMGHRYVSRGALMRHIPRLGQGFLRPQPTRLPFEDELRFVYYRFGIQWARVAMLRAILSTYASPAQVIGAWTRIHASPSPDDPLPLKQSAEPEPAETSPTVTVLIPTLDRYSYLRTLLSQLRQQTVKPTEIIIVDQTARERRDSSVGEDFADLPVRWVYLDRAGQCSSRNTGLQLALGDFVLFIDDDDEVSPSLIADHLSNLDRFRADVSSGVADEVGTGPLPLDFTFIRTSDVFPTNNTMIHRDVLERSGLFDLAYERGQRADGDLGMRIYLSGARMVLNPNISVLHHHAPSGGLRTHKARVITYARSRRSLMLRQAPSATEIYLAKRYFSERQVRETLWQGVLGTFSIRGGLVRKALKALISLLYLPQTIWLLRKRCREAQLMLQKFPEFPLTTRVRIHGGHADVCP